MSAFIDINRPIIPKNDIDKNMIIRALKKVGIKKGCTIDDIIAIIERINYKKESINHYLIAKGIEPKSEGEDILEFNIELIQKNTPIEIIDEEGEKITTFGDTYTKVKSNTLICTLTKSTEKGKPGYNIMGDILKPNKATPIDLKPGKNVKRDKLDENKFGYYSKKTGTVYIIENSVCVY